jgi:hypothetical protein
MRKDSLTDGLFNTGVRDRTEDGKYVGRESWVALITGPHPEFIFNRKFLRTKSVSGCKHVNPTKTGLKAGDILELGDKHHKGRSYWIIDELSQDAIILKPLDRDEVKARMSSFSRN